MVATTRHLLAEEMNDVFVSESMTDILRERHKRVDLVPSPEDCYSRQSDIVIVRKRFRHYHAAEAHQAEADSEVVERAIEARANLVVGLVEVHQHQSRGVNLFYAFQEAVSL